MQEKIKLNRAVFARAFKELKEEGYIDKLGKALNLEPKTSRRARTAAGTRKPAKKPLLNSGEKTRGGVAAGNIHLSTSVSK